MRHKIIPRIIPLVIVVALLAGCNTGQKPFSEMSYKEKGAYFQEIYIKQHDDAAAMAAIDNPSEATLKVYRIKRELLVKAKPLISVYVELANSGGVPTSEAEAEILNLINQLATAAK